MTYAAFKALRDNSGRYRLPGDSKRPEYRMLFAAWKIAIFIAFILSVTYGIISLLNGKDEGILMILVGVYLLYLVLTEKIEKEESK